MLLGGGDEKKNGQTGNAEETTTNGRTGPPSFEDISLSSPETVTVESEFRLTVSATNTGGETGTYEDTIQLLSSSLNDEEPENEPAVEEPVTIESVAPGETGEATITMPAFDLVNDYEFTLADADSTVTVRPEPMTGSVGTTFAIGNSLQVAITDVSIQESVFHPIDRVSGLSTSEEVGAFMAPSRHMLAIVSITAENRGTAVVSADAGTIGIRDAEWYGSGEGLPDAVLGRSESRFYNGELPEINPSESVSGYYIALVPQETARGTIEITGQADATETLPERVWTASPEGEARQLPNMTLNSIGVPETTPLGQDYEIMFSVANEGDSPGTLRGVIQSGGDEWEQLGTASGNANIETDRPMSGVVQQELQPGESTEITVANFAVLNGEFTYRFQPFDQEWQVSHEEATLSLGEQLKSQNNANIIVRDIRTQETITGYNNWDSEEVEMEPEDGNQFVAFRVRFTKRDETKDYVTTPSTGDFDICIDDNIVGADRYLGEIRENWYTPVEGDIDEQGEVSGWEIHEAPAEYSADDFEVRFEEEAGFGSSLSTIATWRQ